MKRLTLLFILLWASICIGQTTCVLPTYDGIYQAITSSNYSKACAYFQNLGGTVTLDTSSRSPVCYDAMKSCTEYEKDFAFCKGTKDEYWVRVKLSAGERIPLEIDFIFWNRQQYHNILDAITVFKQHDPEHTSTENNGIIYVHNKRGQFDDIPTGLQLHYYEPLANDTYYELHFTYWPN